MKISGHLHTDSFSFSYHRIFDFDRAWATLFRRLKMPGTSRFCRTQPGYRRAWCGRNAAISLVLALGSTIKLALYSNLFSCFPTCRTSSSRTSPGRRTRRCCASRSATLLPPWIPEGVTRSAATQVSSVISSTLRRLLVKNSWVRIHLLRRRLHCDVGSFGNSRDHHQQLQ